MQEETTSDADPARPWRASFPNAADWSAPVETGVLRDLLHATARAHGDRPAIRFREARLNYRELAAEVERAAAAFQSIGIGPGDTVALYLPNTLWHPVCFFALTGLGARVAHVSALDAAREISHKLSDSGAIALVTTNWPHLLQNALAHHAPDRRVIVADDARWPGASPAVPFETGEGVVSLDALMHHARDVSWPSLAPDDVALLQYTGGTTGLPKAAMLTHGNLTASVSMYRAWNDAARPPTAEGRTLCVIPLFHIYALSTIMLRCVREGDELLLHQRFDIEAVLKDIELHRATSLSGVPTIWIALANHPGIEQRDFSSLLMPASGGAPMPFEMESRVESLIGRRLRLGWGMTETAPAGTRVPANAEPRAGLIGIPYPNIDMRVVSLDDSARALGPEETGEIAIRGANVFKGYWNKPEETRKAFCEGWFLTGDIGAMNGRGLFRILDRRTNMIISSGFNVYPTAIENALYDHPDVREAIVIGVADPYRGQAAKAFIAMKAGARAPTLESLQHFLSSRVGRHEIPTALEIRDELPRSPAGKLLAKILIEEERAKAAPAATR